MILLTYHDFNHDVRVLKSMNQEILKLDKCTYLQRLKVFIEFL